MHQIAEDILYGLPDQAYLEFVSKYILGWENGNVIDLDPFQVEIPEGKLEEVYIPRGNIDDKIEQSRHKIIVGSFGSGKTTLWRRLQTRHSETLTVSLPLNKIGASSTQKDLLEGKVGFLSPDILAQYIFNTYWENTLRERNRRGQCLPYLRLNEQWMVKLRWFYHHFPPLHYKIPDEFELMAWLKSPPDSLFHPNLAPEDALQTLVDFVTALIKTKDREGKLIKPNPYKKVHLLVDGVERLSNHAVLKLTHDIQYLYSLSVSNLYFDIFIDPIWENTVKELECVRCGYVPIFYLKEWQAQDIKQLLARRLITWGSQSESAYEGDWARQFIPTTTEEKKPIISREAREVFINTILKGAERAATQKNTWLDLPIQVHALKIAYGFIAACAGCWSDHLELSAPLTTEHLNKIIDLYCEANQEEGDDNIS